MHFFNRAYQLTAIILATVLLAACSGAPSYNPTVYPFEIEEERMANSKVKTVVIPHVNLGSPSRSYLEKEAPRIDGYVSTYLKDNGFKVLPQRMFKQHYNNAVRAFGNPVFVTAGGADKISRCVELGATGGHSRHDGSFIESVMAFSEGQGADVVLDPVGASYLADNQAVLALDGRLVIIGLMGGMQTEVNLGLMMMKRQRIIGSTLRARSIPAWTSMAASRRTRCCPNRSCGRCRTRSRRRSLASPS